MAESVTEKMAVKNQHTRKLYFDVCTLCRPFDDQNVMKIRIETDAYYLILEAIQNKKYKMITSPVHFEEINAITDPHERYELLALLTKFGTDLPYDLMMIRARTEYLYSRKFGVADAAHIAFAEATANFFISCDEKLLKKCFKTRISVEAVNPLQFAVMEDLK